MQLRPDLFLPTASADSALRALLLYCSKTKTKKYKKKPYMERLKDPTRKQVARWAAQKKREADALVAKDKEASAAAEEPAAEEEPAAAEEA